MSLVVYSVDEAAVLLRCSTKTVEEWARDGRLAGIKPGGSWVFPAGALALRLDELALEEAADRRKQTKPAATLPAAAPAPRGKRKQRPLPRLVDLRPGAPG
jgi:excisionase family DNA binding protein